MTDPITEAEALRSDINKLNISEMPPIFRLLTLQPRTFTFHSVKIECEDKVLTTTEGGQSLRRPLGEVLSRTDTHLYVGRTLIWVKINRASFEEIFGSAIKSAWKKARRFSKQAQPEEVPRRREH